jgi:hypothetical protein
MSGFFSIKSYVDADLNGQTKYSTWRKSPSQANTVGVWFDLSMSAGNPAAQYYIGQQNTATQLKQSTDGGLAHGGNVFPQSKFLARTTMISTVATALPMSLLLCDYLMFYPFLDESTTDTQILNNPVTLPRYTDGYGVKVMAISVGARTGGQSFYFNYTNSDGVSGRTSRTVVQNSTSVNGSLVTTERVTVGASTPFIPLQEGDSGIRSIESITMLGTDVGLFTLVLVKPLAQTQIRGIDAPVESNYYLDKGILPQIVDDAYLNFICLPQGALNATALHGDIYTIWN